MTYQDLSPGRILRDFLVLEEDPLGSGDLGFQLDCFLLGFFFQLLELTFHLSEFGSYPLLFSDVGIHPGKPLLDVTVGFVAALQCGVGLACVLVFLLEQVLDDSLVEECGLLALLNAEDLVVLLDGRVHLKDPAIGDAHANQSFDLTGVLGQNLLEGLCG